jgi:sigma-B regulation protein RsbU (phosphoserine phosphatase)
LLESQYRLEFSRGDGLSAPAQENGHMNNRSGSVLVVDDNELSRKGLSHLLENEGYATSMTGDGTRVTEVLGTSTFDLVLLDIMMPGLNGMEVLKKIRGRHSMADLPVIMVTGRDGSEDIVEALRNGANDYVTKPLDFPVVLARIQTQLALKQVRDQNKDLERRLSRRNEELELVNQSMRRDLEAAAAVQEALLPSVLPEVPGADFAWLFKPCAELAGDILNIFQLDDKHVGAYVLDVVGHGVAAALLSVTLSRFLSPFPDPTAFLWQRRPGSGGYGLVSPARVAERLNQRFSKDQTTDQYFTFLYGVLHLDSWEFRFVSAGHPAPLHLCYDGQVKDVLQNPGWPIGVGETTYRDQVVPLTPGERLFLYSDGITEGYNARKEQYGIKRLMDDVTRHKCVPLKESLTLVYRSAEAWVGETRMKDDVSLLALERLKKT